MTRAFACVTLCVFAFAPPAAAQVVPPHFLNADGPLARGLVPLPHPGGDKSRWALVIGTNYEADRKLDGFDSLALKNAENDARDVAKKLVECFGYPDKQVIKLFGKEATKDRIEEEVGKLKDGKRVGEGASLFVYFSGHGERDKKGGKLLILPHDVGTKGAGGGEVQKVNASVAVQELMDGCDARQQLYVFDCCHAGALFDLPGEVEKGQWPRRTGDEGAFDEPSVQVIVAARATQRASDGRGGHSPFTDALLGSLDALGREAEEGGQNRRFRADELFGTLSRRFVPPGGGGADQAVQCRRLTPAAGSKRGHGQFLFEVGAGAKFPVPTISPEERALMVAMVPSSFGNWWADEIPWFMPGMRKELYDQITQDKSADRDLTRDQLKAAATKAVEKAREEERAARAKRAREKKPEAESEADKRKAVCLGLMGELLRTAEGSDPWVKTFERAEAELRKLTPPPADGQPDAADPTDLHYLAVLLHKRKEKDKVEEALACYERAGRRYAEKAETDAGLRGLWAVCLLDHAWLEFSAPTPERLEGAAGRLRRIHTEVFKGDTLPAAFRMYALCREGDVYRKLNQPDRCRECYADAIAAAYKADPDARHLLTAATHKQFAWSHLEGWDLGAAVKQFETAEGVADRTGCEDRDGQVDSFHVRHGLAMAKRFQGRPADALADYRKLTPDIADALRLLEGRAAGLNRTELRFLLAERLANSLQRQADCSLFGHPQDLAEAADDYRRAIRACDDLSPASRNRYRKDWLYCRAVALALPGGRRTPDGKAEPLDPRLAAHLFAEAERVGVDGAVDDRTLIIRALAAALVGADPRPPAVGGGLASLAGGLAAAPDRPVRPDLGDALKGFAERPADRDLTALERLMFASAHLIRTAPPDDLRTLDRADDLLRLCRSALRARRDDPGLLTFLRPYFDAAFAAKRRLRADPKELIEIAWEATRGKPYDKPVNERKADDAGGVLAVYFAKTDAGGYDCHLLLDAPGGLGRCFDLKDTWTPDDVLAATAAGDTCSPLPLPDEVRQALKQVGRSCTLECRWRDPCVEWRAGKDGKQKCRLGYAFETTRTAQKNKADPPADERVDERTELRYLDGVAIRLVKFGFPSGKEWQVDYKDEESYEGVRSASLPLYRPKPAVVVLKAPGR